MRNLIGIIVLTVLLGVIFSGTIRRAIAPVHTSCTVITGDVDEYKENVNYHPSNETFYDVKVVEGMLYNKVFTFFIYETEDGKVEETISNSKIISYTCE